MYEPEQEQKLAAPFMESRHTTLARAILIALAAILFIHIFFPDLWSQDKGGSAFRCATDCNGKLNCSPPVGPLERLAVRLYLFIAITGNGICLLPFIIMLLGPAAVYGAFRVRGRRATPSAVLTPIAFSVILLLGSLAMNARDSSHRIEHSLIRSDFCSPPRD